MARAHTMLSRLTALLVAIPLLAGCASMNDEAHDPFEPLNRHIFAFNQAIDVAIVRPVSVTYREIVPDPIKTAVNNFLNYLKSPVILANDLMQGEWTRAGETAERILTNTLALGLVDVAGDKIPFHDEDFGQTLAVWGIKEGPYLVLPLLGPSNPRDGLGILVDWFIDPVYWVAVNNNGEAFTWARTGARVVTYRVDTLQFSDDLERNSLDYYAAIRDIYRQRRNDEIRNRAVPRPPRADLRQNWAFVARESPLSAQAN
jgi:phospholipid-binding lipoprotein MlaA